MGLLAILAICLPWEVSEINAIQSLQLIMRDSFQDMEDNDSNALKFIQQNDTC